MIEDNQDNVVRAAQGARPAENTAKQIPVKTGKVSVVLVTTAVTSGGTSAIAGCSVKVYKATPIPPETVAAPKPKLVARLAALSSLSSLEEIGEVD
ncbi:MAG TPA: hypothetical protein VIQ31_37510 [Phormidium sp.]